MTHSPTHKADRARAQRWARWRDKGAFEEIWSSIGPRIYGQALRSTRDRQRAADVCQEVALVLLQKLGTFRGESALSSWAYRIAANIIGMERRQRAKDPEIAELTEQNTPPVADFGRLAARSELFRVGSALNRMRPRYRSAFILHHIHGVPFVELAARMGISVPAAKSKAHRGKVAFQKILAASAGNGDDFDAGKMADAG